MLFSMSVMILILFVKWGAMTIFLPWYIYFYIIGAQLVSNDKNFIMIHLIFINHFSSHGSIYSIWNLMPPSNYRLGPTFGLAHTPQRGMSTALPHYTLRHHLVVTSVKSVSHRCNACKPRYGSSSPGEWSKWHKLETGGYR